jgi:hypothetical protein
MLLGKFFQQLLELMPARLCFLLRFANLLGNVP